MVVGVAGRRVFEVSGILAVIGLMALGSPASAITWGNPDTTHPNVGAILIVLTLVARRVSRRSARSDAAPIAVTA